MKLELELFLVRCIPEGFHYLQKKLSISQENRDPDSVAAEYLEFLFADNRLLTEKDRYILHSTSWRYEQPAQLVLTYLAYSDLFSFESMNPGLLRLSELSVAHSENAHIPRPRRILPKDVLSHGIRHIAFLLENEPTGVMRAVVDTDSLEVFATIKPTLAGRIAK